MLESLIISVLTYIPRLLWKGVEVIGEAWLKKREKRGEERGEQTGVEKAIQEFDKTLRNSNLSEEEIDRIIAETRANLGRNGK